MTRTADRTYALTLISEAVASGARVASACRELPISVRTHHRWRQNPAGDRRPEAVHSIAANALTPAESSRVLAVCHDPVYASQSPASIIPALADTGVYIASESTFYRMLRAADEQHRRGRARAPHTVVPPRSHVATRPCQVWSWDVTYLKGPVRGLFFYLYMIIDIFSRKIVGWEVWEEERADYACTLLDRAVLAERCRGRLEVVRNDNGPIQKASTLRVKMIDLGVDLSYSRPGVSNDNAYSESLFRTLKYRPVYPEHGFADPDVARAWVHAFVEWYNTMHRHSGIQFVTPIERHTGCDVEILARRHAVYEEARARHPERWSGSTRDWTPKAEVHLTPLRDAHIVTGAA